MSNKRPRRLTREQKLCLSAHKLNPADWFFLEETDFYYKVINKSTNTIKSVDKFRREKGRW